MLLAIGGVFALSDNGKVNTEVNFLSDSNLNNGDHIEILLKDTQGNPLAEQNIAIIYEANGNEEDYHVITDSEGKAYLTLTDEPCGEHKVTVKYEGDDKYNGCVAEETIIINEGVSENAQTSTVSTATASTVKYHNNTVSTQNSNYKTNTNNNYKTNSTYKTNQTKNQYNTKNNNNNNYQSNYNSKSYDSKKEYVANLYYDSEIGVYYDDFGTVHGGKYDGKEIVDVRANHNTYRK